MNQPLLEIDDLTLRFRGLTAVNKVDLVVNEGEIVAVIGPNGAGKTSLLEAVVGALPLSAGRVRFRGRSVERFRERAGVFAFMPDAAEPPSEVRVDALMQHMQRSGAPPELLESLLDALRLGPLRRSLVGELSRGEKRRLLLLGALCSNRPVAVLDEPLGVFDPLQLIGVLEVVRRRAEAGGSFLISVHQMADAEKVAARIVLLDAGHVVAVGSLAELRAHAGCPSGSLEDVFLQLLRTGATHAAP